MVVVGVGVPRAPLLPTRSSPLVGVVVPLVPAGSCRGAVASVLLLLRRRIDGVRCFSFPAASAASSMPGSCIPLASSCISPASSSLFACCIIVFISSYMWRASLPPVSLPVTGELTD
ncbi:Os06g0172400 [Oryza sativa Japonica Group]|uniref:Os06g0172400 protein n=1 Tax=Oryza sativa subsp. japonica TaxID=39947 RepID=A0A0P0WTG1_ORYSJ|nr:Os06g0172400 [Oryza sativa Japonica Group]